MNQFTTNSSIPSDKSNAALSPSAILVLTAPLVSHVSECPTILSAFALSRRRQWRRDINAAGKKGGNTLNAKPCGCDLNVRGEIVTKSSSLLHSSAGDQKSRPRLVVQATDLDYRMTVRCIVDELSTAYVHAGVCDLIRRSAKK